MTRCLQPGCGATAPCRFHGPANIAAGIRFLDTKLAEARRRARASQDDGASAEEVAGDRLRLLGIQQLVHIDIGWRVLFRAGRVVSATPREKVAGDWRGLLLGGRSVLCEVKWTGAVDPGEALVLSYGRLSKNQHHRLTEHHQAGGLSLLAWVSPGACFLLRWPVAGFRPRSSLSFQAAAGLNLTSLKDHHAQ